MTCVPLQQEDSHTGCQEHIFFPPRGGGGLEARSMEKPCVLEKGRTRNQVREETPSPTGNHLQWAAPPGILGAEGCHHGVHGNPLQPHAVNLLPTRDVMQIHATDQHGGKTTGGKRDVSLLTSPPPLR